MGKRHLEQAAAQTGIEIKTDWQPFFLNHNTPAEGEDMYTHLAHKYGEDKARTFTEPGNPLDVAGEKVGIRFNKSRRIIRTAQSHRLVEWCKKVEPAKEDALMEALFKAYFEEASDLSKDDELIKCCVSVGLDPTAAADMLKSNDFRSEVVTKAMSWTQRRVTGVPFFIIHPPEGANGNSSKPVAFSGAQPAALIAEVLQEQVDTLETLT